LKRTLIIFMMVNLLLGMMACQISYPTKDRGLTSTIVVETQPQPTQTATVPLAPTKAPSAEPTFTATNPPPTPTVDPVLDPSRLVLESRNHSEENTALPGFRINSTFPVFTSPIDERLTHFNGDVEELINNLQTSFRTDALAIPYDPNFGTNQSNLEITYQTTYFQRGIISIYFGVSYYMSGAAHPNGYSLVLNYDLLEGAQINLADVFLPGSDYLQVISDISTTTLSNEGRLEFPEGALPDEVNYKNWNITPTGLRITFDPYQVGPYAMGFQVVDVPYADLSSILRSDGAIGRVLAP
jgi:hypothetical protein